MKSPSIKKKKSTKSKKKTNQQVMDELTGQRMALLKDLSQLVVQYNDLAREGFSAEDWIFGMPIESVRELRLPEGQNRRTRLGDLKARSYIKKKSASIESQLTQLDIEIRNVQILLVEERIETILNSK